MADADDEEHELSEPGDDTGSETLARYEFQHVLAALAFTIALIEDPDAMVLCEWSEDFVVVCGGSVPELVSVKHLEPSQGPWTLSSIVDRGGLKHLFERWKEAKKQATCTLKTNGGLKGGPREAAAIPIAARQAVAERGELVGILRTRLGATTDAEVHAFLDSLTIEAELPKRDDLLPRILVDTLPRIGAQLGWPPDEAPLRFEAICDVVATASRSDVRSEARDPDGPNKEVALARARAKKTVTRAKVEAAWARFALSDSLMVEKLERGGLGPTDIERCKRLREEWLRLERRWDPELPGTSEAARLRDQVQDIAAEAEAEARAKVAQGGYAAEMRTGLVKRISASEWALAGEALNVELVLGAAYDETDRCRIWWSDRFDVRAKL